MWEWLTRYPSGRIEDVGTLYEKDLEDQDVAEYDYIIVGGLFWTYIWPDVCKEGLQDVFLRIDWVLIRPSKYF